MAGTLKMLYATNAGRHKQTINKKKREEEDEMKGRKKYKRECLNGNICFVKHAFNFIFLWLYNRTERGGEIHATHLVKTKHNNVADNIVSCCDKADCDFCMARCKSFWN